MKKIQLCSVGLLQALGVTVYCTLVGGVFWIFQKFVVAPPQFLGTVLMLILLVFSTAVTGSMVFGYPVYLAINKKTREALTVLAYTLMFFLAIIFVIAIVLFALV